MDAKQFEVMLKEINACTEAREWTKGKSLAEAWDTCERADWMLWLCGRMAGSDGWPTHQQIVLVACEFAETSLKFYESKYPKDDRPRKAIETARKWANGQATIEEVRASRTAAYAAAADACGQIDLVALAQKCLEY